MEYKNFRASAPFDFSKELIVIVNAVQNVWASRGRQIRTQRVGDELLRFQTYVQVLDVAFRSYGTVGAPDAFTAVMNIGVSAAIFGLAKVVVDFIGRWILEEFYAKKMLGAEEWNTLTDGETILLYLDQPESEGASSSGSGGHEETHPAEASDRTSRVDEPGAAATDWTYSTQTNPIRRVNKT